jgi:hypothetical protein
MFYSLKRFIITSRFASKIIESKRPLPWKKASRKAKQLEPWCHNPFCRSRKNLEADDHPPYRFTTQEEQAQFTVEDWLARMGYGTFVFCHDCHRMLEHDKDPDCLRWNPMLRELLIDMRALHGTVTIDPPTS